jgi:hypothetical protein
MKKRIVSTLILIASALLSNAQTIGIQHDNAPNPDVVTPCSSQTYELTNVAAYLGTLPSGWKICSVQWEDGGYHVLQTTTDTKVTLTVSSKFTLMAYVTLGDANCSQQTHTTSSTIAVDLIPMALSTPVVPQPPTGCTQAFSASTSIINDASHYVPSGGYSVAWNLPAGWTYSPAALSTTITPTATTTRSISATLTLSACPYSVTSPVYSLSAGGTPAPYMIASPALVCTSSQDYSIDASPTCGALNYTYTITPSISGVVFTSNGQLTYTTAATTVNVSFPSGGGNFLLSVTANYPGGVSSPTASYRYYFGLPQMYCSISKWVGYVFTAQATNYPGATYHWTVAGYPPSTGGSIITKEVACGVNTPISVYAVGACGTTNTATITVNPSCTGGGPKLLNVSPNPVQGVMKITLLDEENKAKAAGKGRLVKAIRVVDKGGRIVRRWEFGTGTTEAFINTSGLAADIYILQVFDGERWVHREIIVK